jgi:hypothetical protein
MMTSSSRNRPFDALPWTPVPFAICIVCLMSATMVAGSESPGQSASPALVALLAGMITSALIFSGLLVAGLWNLERTR